jgi:carbon monoxide dehydrogenase subunit G
MDHEFEVTRSPQTVWDFFQDVASVAACLPGAELTEDKGGGVYAGSVSVKLGPLSSKFEGEAIISSNPETRSAVIEGKGVDRRGGSRGQMRVEYRIGAEGPGSKVSIEADVTLSGAAAQFGRTGLISEMSNRLIGEFVACLESKLAAETPEAAAQFQVGEVRGLGLFLASLWAWLKRLLQRR